MTKKLILLTMLVFCMVIISACDNLPVDVGDDGGYGNDGNGQIMGTIENFKPELGENLDVNVLLIEEDVTTEGFNIEDITIIDQTTAASDDNCETYNYSISNIPHGEYYVIAYKDSNGNGLIDVIEEGPIDAAGYYGMPPLEEMISANEGDDQSPTPVKVIVDSDETITEIDFPIYSIAVADTQGFEGTVYEGEGDPLSGVEVALYGSAGIQVAETVTTGVDGKYSFDEPVVIGEYYIKTTSNDLMPSLTPLFYIIPVYLFDDTGEETAFLWSAFEFEELVNIDEEDAMKLLIHDNDENSECLPDLLMYTEEDAAFYGYEAGNVFFTGQVTRKHGKILVPDDHTFGGEGDAEVLLNPMPGHSDPGLDNVIYYDEGFEPEETLENTEDHGWFTVKDVPNGQYLITAEKEHYEFFQYRVIVEEDTNITVEIALETVPN